MVSTSRFAGRRAASTPVNGYRKSMERDAVAIARSRHRRAVSRPLNGQAGRPLIHNHSAL
jgi:hypothetical protein